MRIVDLSMPIGPPFRWGPEVQVKGDIGAGDPFRVTRLSTTCHGFTHIDAMAHFVAAAPTIAATTLDRGVGPCRILDLRGAAPNQAIGPERLAAADPDGPEGEILLLSAGWDRQRDPGTPAYWRDAPYVTREGAEWLLALRLPPGLHHPAPPRRRRGAARRARHACGAARRRADADRVPRQHERARRPAHVPVRRAAQNPDRGRRPGARLRDRGLGRLSGLPRPADRVPRRRPGARSSRAAAPRGCGSRAAARNRAGRRPASPAASAAGRCGRCSRASAAAAPAIRATAPGRNRRRAR